MSRKSGCWPNTLCKQSWQGPAPLQSNSHPGERESNYTHSAHSPCSQLLWLAAQRLPGPSVQLQHCHRLGEGMRSNFWPHPPMKASQGIRQGEQAAYRSVWRQSQQGLEVGMCSGVWLHVPMTLSGDNTGARPAVQCARSPNRQDEDKHPVWPLIQPNWIQTSATNLDIHLCRLLYA